MKNDILIPMDRTVINIKISGELKEALQEISEREGLPVSKLVLTSLAVKYPELVDLIIKH